LFTIVFKRVEISYKTTKGQNLARESWLNVKMCMLTPIATG
jgi:hypothetical protein